MPRRARELTADGIYHVYNRGNNRVWLFKEPDDFGYFKRCLQEARDALSSRLYHYCLMGNHYHLLVRIRQELDLPRFLRGVQLSYLWYYRKKYGLKGHLFQGRYKNPRISEESYFLQCGRYIERNPVKALLVSHPAEYPWSSAPYYCRGTNDPLITENPYYEELGDTISERQTAYRTLLEAHDPYERLVDHVFKE